MRKLDGISVDSNGYCCQVRVEQRGNHWSVVRIRRWAERRFYIPELSCASPAGVAVEMQWRSIDSVVAREGCRRDVRGVIAVEIAESLVRYHSQRLGSVMNTLVSSETFLATIVQAQVFQCPSTFLSVYCSPGQIWVGLVHERVLEGVMALPLEQDQSIAKPVLRVRNYLRSKGFEQALDCALYIIGSDSGDTGDARPVSVECFIASQDGSSELDVLRAVGAALEAEFPSGRRVAGPTASGRLAPVRATVLRACAVVALCAVLVWVGIAILARQADRRVRDLEHQYRVLLASNTDIKQSIESNRTRAKMLTQLNERRNEVLPWAKLLRVLAQSRPSGVWFEKLGSDVPAKGGRVKIALSGSAVSEKQVLELIRVLQSEPFLSKVELVSVVQGQKNAINRQFRILCELDS